MEVVLAVVALEVECPPLEAAVVAGCLLLVVAVAAADDPLAGAAGLPQGEMECHPLAAWAEVEISQAVTA